MSIKIKTVPVGRVLHWYQRAWQMFKEQPGLWMFATFVMFLVMLVSALLDIVGFVARAMVMPFLLAGFYHLAFRANHQVGSKFNDMFAPFKDKQAQTVLLQIGLVGLLFNLLALPSAESFYAAFSKGEQPADVDVYTLTALNAGHFLLTFYAIPVAFFHHERNVITTIITSVKACLMNLPVLLIFAISSMFLVSFALALTMGLALTVIMPWLMIVSFLSFSDVIGGDFTLDDENKDDDDDNDMTIIA